KQEQDDHGAHVDEDERPGDELRRQEEEEGGDPAHRGHEEQGGVDHVPGRHHPEPAEQRGQGDGQEGPVDGLGDPVGERHFSSSGWSGTVASQSCSLSMSCIMSPICASEYSYSGLQNSASNGQTSTQMPQYMQRA